MSDPIVIWNAIENCESCDREVELWTDGFKAYAVTYGWWSSDPGQTQGWDAEQPTKTGKGHVVVLCMGPRPWDQPCGTLVDFNLTLPFWKVPDETLLEMLNYGEDIKVE